MPTKPIPKCYGAAEYANHEDAIYGPAVPLLKVTKVRKCIKDLVCSLRIHGDVNAKVKVDYTD